MNMAKDLVSLLTAEKHTADGQLPWRSPTVTALLGLEAGAQAQAVAEILAWMRQQNEPPAGSNYWFVRTVLLRLLERDLPLTQTDMLALLDWSAAQPNYVLRGLPQLLRAGEHFLKHHPLTIPMRERATALLEVLQAETRHEDVRKWMVSLRSLAGLAAPALPLNAGEAWADAALADVMALDAELRSAWREVLLHCQTATSGKP